MINMLVLQWFFKNQRFFKDCSLTCWISGSPDHSYFPPPCSRRGATEFCKPGKCQVSFLKQTVCTNLMWLISVTLERFVTMELIKLNQSMNCVHTLYYRLFEYTHLLLLNKLNKIKNKDILDWKHFSRYWE